VIQKLHLPSDAMPSLGDAALIPSDRSSRRGPSPAAIATLLLASSLMAAHSRADEAGWESLFDGGSLTGWHVSAKTGHSRTSGNTSGGRWVVEDGAVVGSQDMPGNGGIVLTDREFGDFEVVVEMRNDFGPDSGLFLRSTEDGKAYQAMIDYHAGGNLMGIYGEGLGGKPHIRNYNFERHGQWNELRARIVGGEKPTITTWINGVKISEWTETEARHPPRGRIALQIHGGGSPQDYAGTFVRYRGMRVREIPSTK
jgi:hypothetical protein